MDPIKEFNEEKIERIRSYSEDSKLLQATKKFHQESTRVKYTYNFT